jgi:hypothetical protein
MEVEVKARIETHRKKRIPGKSLFVVSVVYEMLYYDHCVIITLSYQPVTIFIILRRYSMELGETVSEFDDQAPLLSGDFVK